MNCTECHKPTQPNHSGLCCDCTLKLYGSPYHLYAYPRARDMAAQIRRANEEKRVDV